MTSPATVQAARLQNATANGNGNEMVVSGFGTVTFQLSGTFVAVVHFEGSVNGIDFFPLQVISVSGGSPVSSAASPGAYRASIAALREVRARVGSYTSGTVVVDAMASSSTIGETGPAGPAGPSGSSTAAYTHTQASPSATWVITHNLGYRPAGVHVEDSGGSDVEGDVTHDSVNQLTLTFGASFSGVAYLS